MRKTRIGCVQSLFAFLLGVFLLSILSSSVLAATAEVESIRQEIWNRGARWQADDTSITKLPAARRRMRVGLLRGAFLAPKGVPPSQSTPPVGQTLPASLDYRIDNYVTPIRDQGDCGSCWAFATTAALESQELKSTNGVGWSDLDLSEQVLVSCGGAGNCNGGYIDRASNFIESTGLPTETCFPYTATNNNCSNARCTSWQSVTSEITGWQWVATTSPTVDGLKSALVTYGPLVTTMAVYNDFFSYRQGVYSYVGGNGDTYQGGHAIEIIGYDDTQQAFIVKNSWGAGWGEAGFFLIAYSQLGNPVQFGYYTIAYVGYKANQTTCSYSISPTSVSVTYSGGSASDTVSSQPGCSWTAASNASWISVTSGANGTYNGTVNYNIGANSTSSNRSGTLTIAGKTLSVTQTGQPAQTCSYSISPQSATLTYSGGSASDSVTSQSGCSWTAVSNASWISVTSGASGTGNGTVKYKASANNTSTSRTGTLTIAGQALTVTQTGKPCSYSISPTSVSATYSGGSASDTVTSQSGCSWTAVSNAPSWISVTSGAQGSGKGTVKYSVSANNSSTSRTGTLTIAGKTLTVKQTGQTARRAHAAIQNPSDPVPWAGPE